MSAGAYAGASMLDYDVVLAKKDGKWKILKNRAGKYGDIKNETEQVEAAFSLLDIWAKPVDDPLEKLFDSTLRLGGGRALRKLLEAALFGVYEAALRHREKTLDTCGCSVCIELRRPEAP